MQSMTGYGKSSITVKETSFTFEIRSINHRYLNIKMHLPQPFLYLEDPFKQMIQEYFKRGRIEVYLHMQGDFKTEKSLRVNWPLLEEYLDIHQRIKNNYSLDDELAINEILAVPEILTVEEIEGDTKGLKEHLIDCLKKVCHQVKQAREKEAVFLKKDIEKRLNRIRKAKEKINQLKHKVSQLYKARIEERIKGFLADDAIDPVRLHQEIALLIERGDITEEITRLKSHLSHFQTVLNKGREIGRTLDFITQEINRELNTIGSKTIDGEMNKKIIEMKSETEKIREQIQNIE